MINSETEIQSFFSNSSVFLTGGTGFLGKVLLEKLLRHTNVKCIYLLIRPKKGKHVAERLRELFSNVLFDKLHAEKPGAVLLVVPIVGDCLENNLGISIEDQKTLSDQVEVVIHAAAAVHFGEAAERALAINTRATLHLVLMAKNMMKLKSFVHISSIFANCLQLEINESYYTKEIGYTAEEICKMLEACSSHSLEYLWQCYPNVCSFSKALAEQAVLAKGSGLPICITRLPTLSPIFEDPVPGWAENNNIMMSVLSGVASGVLRVIYMNPEQSVFLVPVNYCANAVLASAMQTSKLTRTDSPATIYNMAADSRNAISWKDCTELMMQQNHKVPLSQMLWYPFLIVTNSKHTFTMLNFLLNYLPAIFFDLFSALRGKERMVLKSYKFLELELEHFNFFMARDWRIGTAHLQKLLIHTSKEDTELFPFDMLKFDWLDWLKQCMLGNRKFIASETEETIPKAVQLYQKLYIVHRMVQFISLAAFGFLFYCLIFRAMFD